MFCERSAFPLAVPSALVASIWDQVNEGLRAVPRGGAEVGGLLLGRQSQTGIVLAENAVPIPIEYRFGPSFRLSDVDLNGIHGLMASVQKDPSKAVVGFYRSRTRNDSHSQESDSELLAALEQAHTSFASNFHYYIAFTPLSKMSMTASVSLRKDDGWDEWQHMTLRSNPLSATQPIEFETPPKASPTPAPALEPAPARPPVSQPPVAHSERRAVPPAEPYAPHPDPYAPPQPPPPPRALANPEPRALSQPSWTASSAPDVLSRFRRVPGTWYIGGAVVVAAIVLGAYLRSFSEPRPRVTFSESPAVPPATVPSRAGFSAAREGPLWRLTWDRAAVAALNPTGAVLAIRDGGKEQQVGLTPSDLSSGTILYTPQTSDLLFSLNLVLPGTQVAEEHVRVLEAPRTPQGPAARAVETPSARDLAEPVKIVVRDQVRTLRPFTPAGNGPIVTSSRAKGSAAEMPPPPSIGAPASSPLSSTIQFSPAPVAPVPAPRENREVPVNAAPIPVSAAPVPVSAAPVVPSPLPETSNPREAVPGTIGPKVVRRVNPTFTGQIPAGAGTGVQVHVEIDARGAVTKVTPVAPNAVNFRMVDAAARAAKFWVFEPARKDGRPVPSEMILDFHFSK